MARARARSVGTEPSRPVTPRGRRRAEQQVRGGCVVEVESGPDESRPMRRSAGSSASQGSSARTVSVPVKRDGLNLWLGGPSVEGEASAQLKAKAKSAGKDPQMEGEQVKKKAKACYQCGEVGHLVVDCPDRRRLLQRLDDVIPDECGVPEKSPATLLKTHSESCRNRIEELMKKDASGVARI